MKHRSCRLDNESHGDFSGDAARSSSHRNRSEFAEAGSPPKDVAQIEKLVGLQMNREISARNRVLLQQSVVAQAQTRVDGCERSLARTMEEKAACSDFLREKVLHRTVCIDDIRRWEHAMARVTQHVFVAKQKLGDASNDRSVQQQEFASCNVVLRRCILKLEKYKLAIELMSSPG